MTNSNWQSQVGLWLCNPTFLKRVYAALIARCLAGVYHTTALDLFLFLSQFDFIGLIVQAEIFFLN